MLEIQAQITKDYKYAPLPMCQEKVREHKPNQIVTISVKGVKKPRSVIQLNTYWAVCKTVADNSRHRQWNTKEKVDFQCRVSCHFVDPDLVVVKPDGSVQFSYRSIAFKNLSHIEACNYFDRAFEVMADFLGTSVDKLIEITKQNMG